MSLYKQKDVSIEEKSWVVSEIKQTLVNIYQIFVQQEGIYNSSLLGFGDKVQAKANYVVSLYGLYKICIAGFEKDFEKEETLKKIVKLDDTIDIDSFRHLIIKGKHYSDEKLILMGLLLNNWLFRYGYFRLLSAETVYANTVAMLEAEDKV